MPVFNKTYLVDVLEQWTFGFHKEQKISWPTVQLLASQ